MVARAPDLFEPKPTAWQTRIDAHVLQHDGICPFIMAYVLGVPVRNLLARQRKLGLRKCKTYISKGQR